MGRGKSKIGGTNNFDESTVEIARIMTFGTSNRRDIVRRLMATQDSFKGLTFADAILKHLVKAIKTLRNNILKC